MNLKDLKRRDFIAKATVGTVGAAAFYRLVPLERSKTNRRTTWAA